jgi:hypothetical protein
MSEESDEPPSDDFKRRKRCPPNGRRGQRNSPNGGQAVMLKNVVVGEGELHNLSRWFTRPLVHREPGTDHFQRPTTVQNPRFRGGFWGSSNCKSN